MLPRERVLTTLRRQVPDRLPYHLRLTAPVLDEMERRTGSRSPETHFDTDIRDEVIAPSQRTADFDRFLAGKPAGAFINDEGSAAVKGTYKHYTQVVPLIAGDVDLKTIASLPIADIDAPERFVGYQERVRAIQGKGYAVRGRIGCIFEWAWQVRGFEDLLLDFMDRPDRAELLLDRKVAVLCRAARLQVAAGIDVLGIHDDIAMQTGPMMSLATWRRWLKPRWATVLAAAREVRPDVLVWYHSDGNATAFIPELIEIGVNILNPIQPECMDGPAIKKQFGDRLAFWGGVGSQRILPHATPSAVRREVRRLMETLGAGGGLLIDATHQIQPDVPWENIVAMVEAARESFY